MLSGEAQKANLAQDQKNTFFERHLLTNLHFLEIPVKSKFSPRFARQKEKSSCTVKLIESVRKLIENERKLIENEMNTIEIESSLMENERNLIENKRNLIENERNSIENKGNYL